MKLLEVPGRSTWTRTSWARRFNIRLYLMIEVRDSNVGDDRGGRGLHEGPPFDFVGCVVTVSRSGRTRTHTVGSTDLRQKCGRPTSSDQPKRAALPPRTQVRRSG